MRSDPEILDLDQAAAIIHASKDRLRELAENRRIPHLRIGQEWCFNLQSLKEWLSDHGPSQIKACSASESSQLSLFGNSEAAERQKKHRSYSDTAFPNNRFEPLHRWVPWIAGFSASFVEDALRDSPLAEASRRVILDPFAGVGTTLLEGLKRGYDVIGFEINPYAALVCNAKLSSIELNLDNVTEEIRCLDILRNCVEKKGRRPSSAPRPISLRGHAFLVTMWNAKF
ncbi:MAG: excisionase family DNA-binding protein [Candidatus Coatesbacteria bacterium]|nr:excisionase family DNA-binding protein [Candidatus Coatesbacteria bacterium]